MAEDSFMIRTRGFSAQWLHRQDVATFLRLAAGYPGIADQPAAVAVLRAVAKQIEEGETVR